jgi:hypothetical protein
MGATSGFENPRPCKKHREMGTLRSCADLQGGHTSLSKFVTARYSSRFRMAAKLPETLLARIAQVTNKRARLVLDTIAEKGKITTEELQKLGYDHAPRAARDVRELGFTLVTTMIKNASGKRMAEYSLALNVEAGKTGRLSIAQERARRDYRSCWGKVPIMRGHTRSSG